MYIVKSAMQIKFNWIEVTAFSLTFVCSACGTRENHPLAFTQGLYHSQHSQVVRCVLLFLAWENKEGRGWYFSKVVLHTPLIPDDTWSLCMIELTCFNPCHATRWSEVWTFVIVSSIFHVTAIKTISLSNLHQAHSKLVTVHFWWAGGNAISCEYYN